VPAVAMARIIRLSSILIVALALALSACGGSDDATSDSTSTATSSSESSTTSTTTTTSTSTTSTTTASTPTSGCSSVETVDVETGGTHFDRDFTVDDYETNPPTGGDHNPIPLEAGKFYSRPPGLGESVHLLEHGAVIGWTNGLSRADQKAVETAFNKEYSKGYVQLAVVENPDLDGPFALSSWGALQKCGSVDADAISSFVEEHYAPSTTGEGALACAGKARRLPACRSRKP